jgi:hypothetical protein
VAFGGTGVTSSSGANSVMIRDANQNVSINRLNQSSTAVTAAGGTTTLTAASTFSQILNGTGGQTFKLPDATTLTNTTTFEFNNNATGTLTITDYANATVGTISSGGAAAIALLSNATVGGTWDVHAYIPESVTWGTNALVLGSTVITGGTWNGGTIATGYGGTGLTSYTSGGAVYANSSSTLTSGTLPVTAGGTGNTTGNSATTSQTNFSNLTIGGSQVLYAGNYNSYAPTLTGTGASGTWGISISGNAATATTATSAPNYLPLAGGTVTGAVIVSATATSPSDSTPTALSYSRLQGYGNIHINADTDGSTTEYVYITAGYGTASSTAANGLAIGYSTLTWKNNTVLTAANYNSYAPTLTGTGATGTWAINISGNAATATTSSSTTGNAATATILKAVNVTSSTVSTWNPGGLTYQAWGQAFTNSAISGDSGDITMWLRPSQYSGGGTELNMYIDGDYYSGTGAYRVLNAGNYNSYAPTLTGTGATGTWAINISGNAATATTAANYMPLAGGTFTDNVYFSNSGTTKRGIMGTVGDNDFWFVGGGATASNTGFMEIATGDDGQTAGTYEPIYVSQYGPGNPLTGTLVRRGSLLDNNGNTSFPGTISNPSIWINNGVNTGSWNENIRLFDSPDGVSTIAFGASGTSGQPRNSLVSYSSYLAVFAGSTVVESIYNNYLTASGSYRAPIFYDSNDTAYYGDFNNTSVFSKLTLNGKQTAFNQGIPPASGTSTPAIQRFYAGYGTYGEVMDMGFNVATSYGWIQATNYSNLAVNYPLLLNPNGGNVGIGTLSPGAPLAFTDSLGTKIQYNGSNANGYTVGLASSLSGGDALMKFVAGATGAGEFGFYTTSNLRLFINNAGNVTANVDFRAPIFYDSDNTGYYLNPNGTSNIGGTYLECNASTGRGTYGKPLANLVLYATVASGSGYNCIDFRSGGNYPSDGAQIYYDSAISGSESSRLTIRVENDADDSILLRAGQIIYNSNTVDGGSTNPGHIFQYAGSDRMYVYSDNVTAVNSFRAPIFYDSNDTGYYIDPNGTSNMSAINLNAFSTFTGGLSMGTAGGQKLWVYRASTIRQGFGTDMTGNSYESNWFGSGGPSSQGRLSLGFISDSDGTTYTERARVQASGGILSAIYYDIDNTAYYCDPNGRSALNQATFANGLAFSVAFVLSGSGATLDNSTGARLTESYGPYWNLSNSATWHHQIINGSSLVGISAGGGNYGGGNILASGNITAYYSDERLKTKITTIESALDKVKSLEGFIYIENDLARSLGYTNAKEQAGVSAQRVQAVLPQAVSLAPVDMQGVPETGDIISKSGENYLTVDYSRLVPLLIEAIKELSAQVDELKKGS